jgi:hypothetical protein
MSLMVMYVHVCDVSGVTTSLMAANPSGSMPSRKLAWGYISICMYVCIYIYIYIYVYILYRLFWQSTWKSSLCSRQYSCTNSKKLLNKCINKKEIELMLAAILPNSRFFLSFFLDKKSAP